MVSSFRPPAEYTAPASRTQVALSKLAFTVADDGTVEFDELSSEDVASPTYIHDEKLGKGTMKIVFKVSFRHRLSRFESLIDMSSRLTRPAPPTSKNASTKPALMRALESLLKRTTISSSTRWYCSARLDISSRTFTSTARNLMLIWIIVCSHSPFTTADVNSTLGLMVSEAWLATETITEEGNACPAAGIEEDNYDTACTSGITWLLEPFRGGPVKKHCGTLLRNTTFSPGRLAATINAFIHFTYLYSQKSMVLCDVQCKYCCLTLSRISMLTRGCSYESQDWWQREEHHLRPDDPHSERVCSSSRSSTFCLHNAGQPVLATTERMASKISCRTTSVTRSARPWVSNRWRRKNLTGSEHISP